MLRVEVACLMLKGAPSVTPVLIARTREGVFSIESDLCILLAELEEVRGGERADGPVETEFEKD